MFPSIVAVTPWPATAFVLVTCWSLFCLSFACFKDREIGWFEKLSAVAAYFNNSLFEYPIALIFWTLNFPSVSVPVLSHTTISVFASDSK